MTAGSALPLVTDEAPPAALPTTAPPPAAQPTANQAGNANNNTPLLNQNAQAANPPMRRANSTNRVEERNAVQERMRAETAQTIRVQMRSQLRMAMPLIFAVMASVLVVVLVSILLTVRALWATLMYWDTPCDQPLRYYVFISWGYGSIAEKLINPKLRPYMQSRFGAEPWQMFLYACLTSVPSWIIFYWGLSMVNKCSTCQDSNPTLYACVSSFIYFQIFAATIYFCIAYVFFLLAHRLMLRLMSFNPIMSCVESVKKLPVVEESSPDLLDPEDGRPKECCICLASLAGGTTRDTVVRTPCQHFFHMECLAGWAKAHLDCPLCRHRIGEPDKPSEVNARMTAERNRPQGQAQAPVAPETGAAVQTANAATQAAQDNPDLEQQRAPATR
eukprot:CAMPEP_0178442614 /NCGR_PEP_ID=MMETSP0689_2-20121128/38292_1 /TAXON_ID=160604 /ORGANISM="Amphidinium massartii, Strain CS-259" /LENGTH=388 /DNA_ID=CAMNT_0020066239 /DNA_START=65 /DNA_END=1231 /DNA_ORIENTATION=-